MKSWVFTFRVHPPTDRVFSARNGADVFFAAHSRVLQRFYMVVPGHGEEEIDAPQMIYLEDEYIRNNAEALVVTRQSRKGHEPKQIERQLSLF